MTNHIEEMMRTAGVKLQKPLYCEYYTPHRICVKSGGYCQTGKFDNFRLNGLCKLTEMEKQKQYKFPTFTAEKQLEIIKLIGKNKIGQHYHTFEMEQDEITNVYYLTFRDKEFSSKDICISNSDFTQALAQLTTELMMAGEFDKEKVKEILSV